MNNLQRFTIQRSSRYLMHGIKTLASTKAERDPLTNWNAVIKDAERVVGYPTSFLNLRWLLCDEVANIASHLQKLARTEHPLLNSLKDYMFKNEAPAWGLIILLVSKMAGVTSKIDKVDFDRVSGILHSQRVMAEVTEMLRMSIMIHKNVLNIPPSRKEDVSDLHYGNKIALLCGDYLLSRSFHDLASLKNNAANEIISSALRDLTEGEFLGRRDCLNRPIPTEPKIISEENKRGDSMKINNSKGATRMRINANGVKEYTMDDLNDYPSDFIIEESHSKIMDEDNCYEGPYDVDNILGHLKEEWVLRNILQSANLLAKACKASMIFAGHEVNTANQAYLLGRNIALAWQAQFDYTTFLSKDTFSLISAPVMLHLREDPSLYELIRNGSDDVTKCDFKEIKRRIVSGNALDETMTLKQEFINRVLRITKYFDDNDGRRGLENLIKNM